LLLGGQRFNENGISRDPVSTISAEFADMTSGIEAAIVIVNKQVFPYRL
jgi:hypothetical protein